MKRTAHISQMETGAPDYTGAEMFWEIPATGRPIEDEHDIVGHRI